MVSVIPIACISSSIIWSLINEPMHNNSNIIWSVYFIYYRSPPSALPLALQTQGFFLPPPPHLGYYEGSPPFSPPPMLPPFLYPQYFAPGHYPTSGLGSGVGYMSPQLSSPHQVPPMVPYNAANWYSTAQTAIERSNDVSYINTGPSLGLVLKCINVCCCCFYLLGLCLE